MYTSFFSSFLNTEMPFTLREQFEKGQNGAVSVLMRMRVAETSVDITTNMANLHNHILLAT